MIETMMQFIIAITGMISVALLASRERGVRMIGCVIGLSGEPAWAYTAFVHEQWGILFLAVWWAVAFIIGIFNNRRKI